MSNTVTSITVYDKNNFLRFRDELFSKFGDNFSVPFYINENGILCNLGISHIETVKEISSILGGYTIVIKDDTNNEEKLETKSDKEESIRASDIVPMNSIKPRFQKAQIVITKQGIYEVSPGNYIVFIENILSEKDRQSYLEKAVKVERRSGISGYGQKKPRSEVCYTIDGSSYIYSKKKHYTVKYPEHVLFYIGKFMRKLEEMLETKGIKNEYTELSNAVDIIYSDEFERGGSISRHKDDEDDWGCVIVYSLGQTRWFRVRNDKTEKWFNAPTLDNSLLVMYGKTFQKEFTHQIDKLSPSDKVGIRLSLNVRFKKGNCK